MKKILLGTTFLLSGLSIAQQGLPSQGLGGAEDPAKLTQGLGIDQKLGEQVPPGISFTDETGKAVQLGQYFGRVPILLIPVFYNCDTACVLTQDEALKSFIKLRTVRYRLGKDFMAVTFTIHPKETHELAMVKKKQLLKVYQNRESATVERHEKKGMVDKSSLHYETDASVSENGWHFLTGNAESIKQLTDAIGFHYKYDAQKDQIQHPAGSFVLTPQGRISKVFFGSMLEPKLLKDALEQASGNAIAQKSEPLLFGCIHVDPVTGQKSLVFLNVIRLLGTILLLGLIVFIISSNMKQRRLPQNTNTGGQ